jgi:hypothetical protein
MRAPKALPIEMELSTDRKAAATAASDLAGRRAGPAQGLPISNRQCLILCDAPIGQSPE